MLTMEDINKALPANGAFEICKRLNDDLREGRISNAEYADHQKSIAERLYPDAKSPLAAFFASAIGKQMLSDNMQPSSGEMTGTYEKRHGVTWSSPPALDSPGIFPTATGHGDEHGNLGPGNLVSTGGNPATSDSGSNYAAAVARQIKALMAQGKTYDEAVSLVHRAEKIAKGI